MKRAVPVVLALAILAGAVFWAGQGVWRDTTPPRTPGVITVYCDTSVRAVLDEIREVFERRSDVRIELHSGPSVPLLEEFRDEPAGVDLFVPGDAYYLEQAQADGLVEPFESLAWTEPAILTQGGNPQDIAAINDLTRAGLRVGVMHPETTALGRLLPELLEQHGMSLDDLEPNLTLIAENDAELVTGVRLGRLDAAIVWRAVGQRCERCAIVPMDAHANVTAMVAVGVSTQTPYLDEAREFAEFLGLRAAQALFEEFHYSLTPTE